jgi:hypothetical protein
MLPKEIKEKMIDFLSKKYPDFLDSPTLMYAVEVGVNWAYNELRPGTPIEEDLRLPESTC